MKEKILKLICYAISLFLFCSYIVILVKSFDVTTPNTEYKMYYITNELAYYRKKDQLADYTPDRICCYITFGNYYNQGIGWDNVCDEGTWMIGKSSTLYFYLPTVRDSNYLLSVNELSSLGYVVNTLYVNDVYVTTFSKEEPGILELEIPCDILIQGLNKFDFRSDNVVPLKQHDPDSDDNRELKMFVYTIELISSPQ